MARPRGSFIKLHDPLLTSVLAGPDLFRFSRFKDVEEKNSYFSWDNFESILQPSWLTTEHGASRLFLVILYQEDPCMVYVPTFS